MVNFEKGSQVDKTIKWLAARYTKMNVRWWMTIPELRADLYALGWLVFAEGEIKYQGKEKPKWYFPTYRTLAAIEMIKHLRSDRFWHLKNTYTKKSERSQLAVHLRIGMNPEDPRESTETQDSVEEEELLEYFLKKCPEEYKHDILTAYREECHIAQLMGKRSTEYIYFIQFIRPALGEVLNDYLNTPLEKITTNPRTGQVVGRKEEIPSSVGRETFRED